jgi:hypothetical protein
MFNSNNNSNARQTVQASVPLTLNASNAKHEHIAQTQNMYCRHDQCHKATNGADVQEVVNCQLLIVSYLLSVIDCQLLFVCQLLIGGYLYHTNRQLQTSLALPCTD